MCPWSQVLVDMSHTSQVETRDTVNVNVDAELEGEAC